MEQASQTTTRKRIWLRRMVFAAIFTVGVIGIALWILTRSWFIIAQIKPELAARLGGEVSIGSAAYEGGGRFVLRNVALRVPDFAGIAGEVLNVAHARVRVDEGRLLRGDVQLREVELDGVFLRLSEDINEGGEFTFMKLNPHWEAVDTDPVAALPRLEIRSAAIEYGVYDHGDYEARGRRFLTGLMQPDPRSWRSYTLHLSELDETGAAREDGISVRGTWNVETNEHRATIAGLALDRTTHEMVPQDVRWWWDNLDLEGRLSNAEIEWREGQPLSVVFHVENVGITLPITADFWGRYHAGRVVAHSARPRLRVHSGTIRFEDNAIKLDDLIGELSSEDILDDGPATVSVPYAVKVNVHGLRPVDWEDREAWINHTLATVPFEMEISVEGFRIARDEDGELPPADLPLQIARAMERFHLTNFGLTTNVLVRREEGAALTTAGRVHITDASGMYDEFPYPLHGIDATISFLNERVEIELLQGRAPSGAIVNIQGFIGALGRNAEVDLHVTSDRAEVDEHMRSALRFKGLVFLDALMNIRAEKALRGSGRIDAGSDNRSEEEPDRAIVAPPFHLGGDVALNLRVYRAEGPNQPTDVTGIIDIHSLGMIYEHFPYPFIVTGGSLRLEPGGVTIIEDDDGHGLRVATIGGGAGYVNGNVRARKVDGGLRALPDLSIKITNDRMNPLITAAIPPGRGLPADEGDESAWPGGYISKPVALLESANLRGDLDYTGRIFHDDGEVEYEFIVDLRGEAQPGAELAATLGDAGLIWPPDLVIRNLDAQVRVIDGEVTLLKFDGDHDHGLIAATGSINWMEEKTRTALDIELIDLKLDRYLLGLLPEQSVEAVSQFWGHYQPSGNFDARFEFRSLGDVIDPPRLLIDPTGATLVIENEPIALEREAGRLILADGRLSFDEFALTFLRGDGAISDGSVQINGSYGLNDDEDGRDLALHAVWAGGRFESPIIVEVVRLIGAQSHLDAFERLNPRGLFNADLSYASAAGDRPRSYGLSLQPISLQIDFGGTTIDAALDTESRISLDETVIHVHHLGGAIGGEAFSFHGLVETGARTRITIDDLAFDGQLMNEQVQAILPRGVRDLFAKINFSDGARTIVEDGRLALAQGEPGNGGHWSANFSGMVRAAGASFDAGMRITEFDGALYVHFEDGEASADDELRAPRLEIDLIGESLLLADRRLTNLQANGITLSESGRSIIVPEITAESYGGLFWATANVGLAEGEAYDARLELVGASVAGLMTGDANGSRPARSRRGTVNAGVRLHGVSGRPESRTGRGMIRAVGGSIESVPLVLQLMQVLQLTLPIGGALDNAHVDILIDGDTAIFERILFESTLGEVANLTLFGEGEMNLHTLELRTQFRSRGGTLIIRDLVGGIGDQLYGIEIVGTLKNPRARVVPLPGLQPGRSRVQARESAAVLSGEAQ